jgi:predicted acyl esterase
LADPFQNPLPEILTNDVPVFAFIGHRDSHHMVWGVTRAMPSFPAHVPHRVYVSTRGHGIPDNDVEWLLHLDLKRRWWDRFLEGMRNGIELEPLAEIGVIPADPADYARSGSLWRHELHAQWPPALPPATMFLTDRGTLEGTAPGASIGAPPIRNRPAPGYGIEQFAQNTRLPTVLSNLPLSRLRFETDPLPAERQVAGRPRLVCDVTTTSGRVQLAAVLYDVPAVGDPVFVTMGATGLGPVAAGRHRIEVELDDVSYSIPVGHRVGLALQNLAIRDLPGTADDYLFHAPEPNDFDAVVHLGGTTPARLDLRWRRRRCRSCRASRRCGSAGDCRSRCCSMPGPSAPAPATSRSSARRGSGPASRCRRGSR